MGDEAAGWEEVPDAPAGPAPAPDGAAPAPETPAALRPGAMTAWATLPLPKEAGPRRHVMLTLRIFGWVAVVATLIAVMGVAFTGLRILWGSSPRIAAVVNVALAFAFVWWTGWTSLRLHERARDGARDVLTFSIVLTVLGLLASAGVLFGAMPINGVIAFGFGVALLFLQSGLEASLAGPQREAA